jgi:type III secretion protein V
VALEAIAGVDAGEKDPIVLTEIARMAMREHITHRYAPHGVLRALSLAPKTATLLRAGLTEAGPSQRLALPPPVAKRLIGEIAKVAGDARVLLAPIELRRHLRLLIAPELFDLAVLGLGELPASLRLEVVKLVDIAPAEAEAA